jgi:hypothetical protein
MILAFPVVELNCILVAWAPPQVQKAIRSVVTVGTSIAEWSLLRPVWLAVPRIAKPPRRLIGGPPSGLIWLARVHWISRATSTTVLRTGDVNDPIWCTERLSRHKEGLPICSAAR